MSKLLVYGVVPVAVGIAVAFAATRGVPRPPSAIAPVPALPSEASVASGAGAGEPRRPSAGSAAIARAASGRRYVFLLFFREDDEATRQRRRVLDASLRKLADRADCVAVSVADPAEAAIVERFDALRSPLPLVVALAPNGAVTGGFLELDEARLLTAFVSLGTERCLAALQQKKVVVLCFRNDRTKAREDAQRGVRELVADPRFAETTEVITLDPADTREGRLLEQCKVEPGSDVAITVLLAPPGKLVGRFEGPTRKDLLEQALRPPSG